MKIISFEYGIAALEQPDILANPSIVEGDLSKICMLFIPLNEDAEHLYIL